MSEKYTKLDNEKRALNLELNDGSKWRVPLMSSLNPREARELARKMRDGDEASENVDVFIDFLDEQCPGLVDAIEFGALSEIAKLWGQAEMERGEDQGE